MSKPVSDWVSGATPGQPGTHPEVVGDLEHSPLVELVAYGFNQDFTGTLRLERRTGEPLTLEFNQGALCAADAAEFNAACQRRALEEYLPPDALDFAEEHGKAHAVDLLTAVEQLLLLPLEHHAQLRASFLQEQVFAMCSVPGDTSFRFVECQSTTSPAAGVEPLKLLLTCLLREPALERARRSVEAFRDEPLSLLTEAPLNTDKLDGVCRQWVARLSQTPTSYADLVRSSGANDKLTALVYALLLTGHVAVRTRPSERPAPMHQSRVPRTISSHALRVTSTAVKSAKSVQQPQAGVASGSPSADRSSGVALTRGAAEQKSSQPRPEDVRSVALSPTLPYTPRVSASDVAPRPATSDALVPGRFPPPAQVPKFDSQSSGIPPQPGVRGSNGSGLWSQPGANSPDKTSPTHAGAYAVSGDVSNATSSRPPVRSGKPSERSHQDIERELAAEAKVVQAWMLGEADRTYLEKSRLFVSKVVRLYPNNPRVRFCYASLQKRANQLDSAIQEFARVVELDATHTDARQELDALLSQRRGRRRR